MARINPLTPSEFPAEMRGALSAMVPPQPTHEPMPTEDRPKALLALGTMAHHPALARAFFTLNGHILRATTLTERQRELLVMRVAVVRKSPYEWAQHLFVARDAGLTDEEIGRIAYGPDAPFWSELEAAVLRAVDELILDGAVSSSTWHTLEAELDHRQLLDLIFTVGTYNLLAWLFNSLELGIDGDIDKLMQQYDTLFQKGR